MLNARGEEIVKISTCPGTSIMYMSKESFHLSERTD